MSAAGFVIELVTGLIKRAMKAGQHVKVRARKVVIKDRRKRKLRRPT